MGISSKASTRTHYSKEKGVFITQLCATDTKVPLIHSLLGYFHKGKRQGQGREFYKSGNFYEGEFFNNER